MTVVVVVVAVAVAVAVAVVVLIVNAWSHTGSSIDTRIGSVLIGIVIFSCLNGLLL
jgi:hypothetical protein